MKIVHRIGTLHEDPDALSPSLNEGNEIAAVNTATFDTWYFDKVQAVQKHSAGVPDYKLHNNILYVHRPNFMMNPSIKDSLLLSLRS